jgi:ribosomal protein L24
MKINDVVRVMSGKMQGKTGVVVRTHEHTCCVVLTKVSEFGVWFGLNELKRIGRVRSKA